MTNFNLNLSSAFSSLTAGIQNTAGSIGRGLESLGGSIKSGNQFFVGLAATTLTFVSQSLRQENKAANRANIESVRVQFPNSSSGINNGVTSIKNTNFPQVEPSISRTEGKGADSAARITSGPPTVLRVNRYGMIVPRQQTIR